MTDRIITAEEARALREAATPGPWSHSADGYVWGVRPEPISCAVWNADAAITAAAPDLAATVEALHAEVERMRALLARLAEAAGRAADTMCPECGPAVQVDEDGCCVCCGNGAMGTYVTERAVALAAVLAEVTP